MIPSRILFFLSPSVRAGVERWRETILDLLVELTGCEAIYERSDAEVRKLEGLQPKIGFARGNKTASRCPIVEYGLNFRVDDSTVSLDDRHVVERAAPLAAPRDLVVAEQAEQQVGRLGEDLARGVDRLVDRGVGAGQAHFEPVGNRAAR